MNAPRDPNVITPRGPRGVALPPGNFSPSNFVGDPKGGKFIDFEAHFGHAIVKDEFLAKAEWADRDNPADAHFGGRSAATPMHGKYDDRQPDGTGDGTGRPYEPGIQGDDPFEGSGAASVPQGRSSAQPAGQPFGKMARALPFQNQLAAFYGGDFGRPNADDEPERVAPVHEATPEMKAPEMPRSGAAKMSGGRRDGWIDFESSMAAMMQDAERTIASLAAPDADDGEDAPVARPRAAKPSPKPVAPAAPQGAPLASRPRAVEPRASEAVKSLDTSFSGLDELVKSLEPLAKAAGHKYISRKSNGKGGYDYVYRHEAHGGDIHVATSHNPGDKEPTGSLPGIQVAGPTTRSHEPGKSGHVMIQGAGHDRPKATGRPDLEHTMDSWTMDAHRDATANTHKLRTASLEGPGVTDETRAQLRQQVDKRQGEKSLLRADHDAWKKRRAAKEAKAPSHAATIAHSKTAEGFSKHADKSRDPNDHRLAMQAHQGAASAHTARAAASKDEDTKHYHEGEAKQHGVRATEHSMEASRAQTTAGSAKPGLGETKSGKPIPHVPEHLGEADKKASAEVHKHGLFSAEASPHVSASQAAQKKHFDSYTQGFTAQDHKDAASAIRKHKSENGAELDQNHGYAHNGMASEHDRAAEKATKTERDAAFAAHDAKFHAPAVAQHHPATTRAETASAKATKSGTEGAHLKAARAHGEAAMLVKDRGVSKEHEERAKHHAGEADTLRRARHTAANAAYDRGDHAEATRLRGTTDFKAEKSMQIESITDAAGRPLKKGLYAYDLSGQKPEALPEEYLYDYLTAFVENAYESESQEVQHSKLDAHDQVSTMASSVMNALVTLMPKNANLMRACKKFSVTKQVVERLLVEQGFYKPRADSEFTDDGLGAMGALLLAQEDFAYSHQPVPFLSEDMFAVPGLVVRGPVEEPADDLVVKSEAGDPHELLAAAHRRAAFAQWGDGPSGVPDQTPIAACPIHDGRDIHKAQMLNHGMLPCTCHAG